MLNDPICISKDDIIIQRKIKNNKHCCATDGNITVVLDTTITDGLYKEGLCREIISVIQDGRKNNKINISEKINLYYFSESTILINAIIEYNTIIKNETLINQIIKSNHYNDFDYCFVNEHPFYFKILSLKGNI
jgi:isoleucyl-tRNA synthetase